MAEEIVKPQKTKTPKTILTVANVPDLRTYQRKGIDLFMKLAKALPDYKFTLAGIDFKLQKHDTLPQNVTLLGTQDAKQLREIYSAHTYYFQGSRVEGLPNVLCEAMLCECIAIGRNVFGMPKAIGDTGFLFNPHEQWNKMIHFITQDKPELGLVGTPKDVNPEVIFNLFENDMIPVIAPLGSGIDGETLNVNGDTVSGAIAAALKADRLLLLTDVSGVQDKDGSIITELNSNQIKNWINEGIISGGMIPKTETALMALEGGVRGVVILDGRVPNACLLELFTEHGAGSLIRA